MWWGDWIDATVSASDCLVVAALMLAIWGAAIAGLVALFRVGSTSDAHHDHVDNTRRRRTAILRQPFRGRRAALTSSAGLHRIEGGH